MKKQHYRWWILVLFITSTVSAICRLGMGQQQQPGSPATPRIADGGRQLPVGRVPQTPFTLNQAEQQQLDQILKHWEMKTGSIQKFSCNFIRWEYQPQWARGLARTISEGVVHFQAPDKGFFRVDSYKEHNGKDDKGEPVHKELPHHIEHWICDGTTIYEFDPRQKKLIERQLPPEWRGKAITDGPLPFLFGAKAEKLKARYWIRRLEARRQGEIWLEILPKQRGDAVNYQRIQVMLAATGEDHDFLPNGMIIFLPDGSHKTFMFEDREINTRRKIMDWRRYNPKTPSGWERIVEDPGPSPANPSDADRIGPRPPRTPRRQVPR